MEDVRQTEQNLPEEGGVKVEMKVGGARAESPAGTPCRMQAHGGVEAWRIHGGYLAGGTRGLTD